ncbi:hypothetical protein OSTOST_13155 [Ostertagia ostertagi]
MTSVKHVHKKYVSKPATCSDWKNIYVVSVFAFVDALQFAFFVWTFWPYCQQLDPTLSASFIGLIMAVSGLGEAVAAPIFAAQMLFTWIGGEGVDVGFMRISMYTAPAILAIVINIACVIFLVFCLEDGLDRYNGSDSDNVSTYSIAAASDSDLERNAVKTVRMDVLAVVVCMWTRAARMLITANVESIGSPFSEVMFGLDNEQVLNYNSMMQGAVGVLTTMMFIVYAFTDYSKW